MIINGIRAALLEAKGEGRFEQKGKKIEFRDNQERLVAFWWANTSAQAAQQIRIFRMATNHSEAA